MFWYFCTVIKTLSGKSDFSDLILVDLLRDRSSTKCKTIIKKDLCIKLLTYSKEITRTILLIFNSGRNIFFSNDKVIRTTI